MELSNLYIPFRGAHDQSLLTPELVVLRGSDWEHCTSPGTLLTDE